MEGDSHVSNNLISWRFVQSWWKTFIYKTVKTIISGGEKNNPVNSRFSDSSFILSIYLFIYLPLDV